jgi:hypothetical protein
MAEHDPPGLDAHLHALRNANDGFAITVWADSEDGAAGWKLWRTLDAKYAENSPGWVMTISGDEIIAEIAVLAATGHPMISPAASRWEPPSMKDCEECGGTGTVKGDVMCEVCDGVGRVQK